MKTGINLLMFLTLNTIAWGLLLGLEEVSFAGRDSGGGVVIVERWGPDFIADIKFLDLYEATKRVPFGLGLTLRHSHDSVEEQLAWIRESLKVDPKFYDDWWHELLEAKIRMRPIPSGQYLPLAPDFHGGPIPTRYRYEQLGYYFDRKILMVNKELLDSLVTLNREGNTHVAAFWTHEAAYKLLRDRNLNTNSDLTRELVGHLFSDPIIHTDRDEQIKKRLDQWSPRVK